MLTTQVKDAHSAQKNAEDILVVEQQAIEIYRKNNASL